VKFLLFFIFLTRSKHKVLFPGFFEKTEKNTFFWRFFRFFHKIWRNYAFSCAILETDVFSGNALTFWSVITKKRVFSCFSNFSKKTWNFHFFDPFLSTKYSGTRFRKKTQKKWKKRQKSAKKGQKTRKSDKFQNFDLSKHNFVLIKVPKSCQFFFTYRRNAKSNFRETKVKVTFFCIIHFTHKMS